MAVATRFRLTDEEMLDLFDEQLPSLLERRPELETRIYHAFMKTFATKVEVAKLLTELQGFRQEFRDFKTDVYLNFQDVQRAIDRLGVRWGIRNESVFHQTMAELLEKSFGVKVEARWIGGEQFDCIIFDGEHILVEISASVGPDIQRKLERKRDLYTQTTGVIPTRVFLVTGAIHSKRAQALREAGFTVIEPEEDALVGNV